MTIPETVQSIGKSAFDGCADFTSLYIKSQELSIDQWAFDNCNFICVSSESITPPLISTTTVFTSDQYTKPLYVPDESIAAYQSAYAWKKFTLINKFPTSLSLNKSNIKLFIDSSTELYTICDSEIDITWSSDDPNVCTIENNVVSGFKAGETTITASFGNLEAKCLVTVIDDEAYDFGKDASKRIYLDLGENVDLSSSIDGTSVSFWNSSNDEIVNVTDEGIASAYSFGEVLVKAKDIDGNTLATFDVFVCPTVTVTHGEGIIYGHHVLYNSTPSFHLNPGNGYRVAGVTHDGKQISDDLISSEGKYTPTEPIKSNSVINLALEQIESGPITGVPSVVNDPNIHIYVVGHHINILGVDPDKKVTIYSLSGMKIYEGYKLDIEVDGNDVYIIEIEGQPNCYKILVE